MTYSWDPTTTVVPAFTSNAVGSRNRASPLLGVVASLIVDSDHDDDNVILDLAALCGPRASKGYSPGPSSDASAAPTLNVSCPSRGYSPGPSEASDAAFLDLPPPRCEPSADAQPRCSASSTLTPEQHIDVRECNDRHERLENQAFKWLCIDPLC
eukprot:2070964-Amphidinium_carterae.1